MDGVEFGCGEVGAGDDEEAGEEADPELAGLHSAEAIEQLGVVVEAAAADDKKASAQGRQGMAEHAAGGRRLGRQA